MSARSRTPHIDISDLRPATPTRAFPAKGVVGWPVEVSAQVLKDGHDLLAGRLRWRAAGGAWQSSALTEQGAGRWGAAFTPVEVGAHHVRVEMWTDRFATWRRDIAARAAAGQDLTVSFAEGATLLAALAGWAERDDSDSGSDSGSGPDAVAARLLEGAGALERTACTADVRLAAGLEDGLAVAAAMVAARWDRTRSERLELWVDRERAGFSTWYELFPRSFGGFAGVTEALGRIADLGFDVLYLPPIHPIGRTFRKGRNNSLSATPDDVGSPWAIGAAEGGHTAIHPALGDDDAFAELVAAAGNAGMEIALDYALQCSPDHPWVAAHPEWFHHLADGTIRYAENPPKKYQDIYPINFWPAREKDRKALWEACYQILEHWIARGVEIFRVDNPHTKPLAFWAWLCRRLRDRHPRVLLLAEAFTAPEMMAKLAEVGFAQSYTYFTWRTHGGELAEYVRELCSPPLVDYFRPNFWPNTPDILEGVLRDGPLSAFALRAVLAATLVPNYGIYSGYELGENAPASPENTEYAGSEKYQLVARDFTRQPNLSALLSRLNSARHRHRALQAHGGTTFHGADDGAMLVYSRRDATSGDTVLCVVNLDPWHAHSATLDLDLAALGVAGDGPFQVTDVLSGKCYEWQGSRPWARLDPAVQPAHVFAISRG